MRKLIIIILCVISMASLALATSSSKSKEEQKNMTSKEPSPVIIVGASEEQASALKKSVNKIHEQWEHIRKAGVFEDAGQYDAAIQEYKIALGLAKTKGDEVVPRASLLDIYEKTRQHSLALEQLNTLIEINPELSKKYKDRKQKLEAALEKHN